MIIKAEWTPEIIIYLKICKLCSDGLKIMKNAYKVIKKNRCENADDRDYKNHLHKADSLLRIL